MTGAGLQGWIGSAVLGRLESGGSAWTDCWPFGVNFLPHPLHRRILRTPIVLVFLAPLLAVPVPPQYGHLCGLPAGILITSRDLEGTGVYKATDSLPTQWPRQAPQKR
jgi:hypothetical protein